MKKKISIAVVLIIAMLAAGGLWVYQATKFEKYITEQLAAAQESLKDHGLTLTYDNLWVSRLFYQVHLVNPKLTATTSPSPVFDVQGEIIASYALFKNAVTLELSGESHLKSSEGPIQYDWSASKPDQHLVTIYRKEYDIFGKHPFLSFDNIQKVSSEVQGMSTLVNGQKFITLDRGSVGFSIDYNDKAMDLAVQMDGNQMQFFAVDKLFIGEPELVDPINTKFRQDVLMHENLGPQDQIISLVVHLNDYAAYWENLKKVFAKESSHNSQETFEALFPEGTRYLVKEFSVKNKIMQVLMKGSFVRVEDKVPMQYELALKVSNQWEGFWNDFYKKVYQNIETANPAEMKQVPFQEFEAAAQAVMPQLDGFGQMQIAMTIDVPVSASDEKKVDFKFKSDLYDLGVAAKANKEGSSTNITTRNAEALMKDLENYVNRASVPFEALHPNEVQQVKMYIKMGQLIAKKFFEPQDAAEQSLDVQIQQGNVKIGKYDLPQFMAILGEAMMSQVSEQ